MNADIRAPEERTCLLCGREEVWDESSENWIVEGAVGELHCIHSWNVTGRFSPIER